MKKILIIQQKMIGDVLVSSILCENLKKAYPTSQLDYMVYESTVQVLNSNPFIDNLVLFKPKHRKSRIEFFRLIFKIRRSNYDIVIDSYSKLESWLTILFLKSPIKISYNKVGRKFLYTNRVQLLEQPTSNIGLIIERRLSLLTPLKLNVSIDPKPKLYVSKEEIDYADKEFDKFDIDTTKRTIMVSILGSEAIKTFPYGQMSKLIDDIVDFLDCNILFNYIPSQIEEAQLIYDGCSEISKEHIYFELLGRNLREFIALMNNCDMIIGNDGGAINMAKALDKPSFIIFSPWIEKKMWATFEDGVFHKSVHLNDYRPELFIGHSQKEIKNLSLELYKEFSSSYIKKELLNFLNIHRTDHDIPKFDTLKPSDTVKLTALVITYNEVDNIPELIESISFANEIIVVDSFSTDGTFELLFDYPNVKVQQRKFSNFSDQRNFATSLSSNDWVLFVDADERISDDLRIEIRDALNEPNGIMTYGMVRKLYFNGKHLKYGGFQTEKVFRLFNRNHAKYDPDKLVHEVLEIKGKAKVLKNKLIHYAISTDQDYKDKLTNYAVLRAQELKKNGVRPWLYLFYIKPAFRFFHMYFIRFGFLDGAIGFKMARLQAFGVRERYVQLKKLY